MKSQKDLIVITGGAGEIGTACAKVHKDKQRIIADYSQEIAGGGVMHNSKIHKL